MIRLLIADDHPVVREGLAGMLVTQKDMELVGQAGNGHEAVELVQTLRPDVTLMDLRMPELDGVGAIHKIRALLPRAKVLVLTTYDTDSDIRRAIEAGASGYVLKDAPREELFRAIRAVAAGQSYLAPAVASRLMEIVRSPAEEPLSGRELEILTLVAGGLSNKEIAHQLHIGEATVKSHLLHAFGKLGVNDRTQAVSVAHQRGLIRLD
jgi:DNA-binding NarL/FixJ family response regulator